MGSPSWSIAPSGHRSQPHTAGNRNREHQGFGITMFVSKMFMVLTFLVASGLALLEVKTRSAVKYLGDTFLLPDGCPVDDPLVQRFYQLCLETRGGDTLCSTDSAICHNMPAEDMKICPFK